MTTLVIGESGNIGRAVLDQLVVAGEAVRASVRKPASVHLPDGVPVVAGDLTRPETLPAVLDGVAKVFLYCLPDGPGRLRAALDPDPSPCAGQQRSPVPRNRP